MILARLHMHLGTAIYLFISNATSSADHSVLAKCIELYPEALATAVMKIGFHCIVYYGMRILQLVTHC
jgi:hypothetical protein